MGRLDAICINQRDNKEKSFQVNMMDRIYKKTTKCLIWLGEAEDDTQPAFKFFDSAEVFYRQMYNPLYSQSTEQILRTEPLSTIVRATGCIQNGGTPI